MTPPVGRIYRKNYEIAGDKFTIEVNYLGCIPTGQLAQVKPTWMFNIIVGNTTVYMGMWYHLQSGCPTNDEVCDGVAQFNYPSFKISNAQHLVGLAESELDRIVEKCATFMHGYFLSENSEHTDYDIVNQYMDDEEWVVVLRPNYMANRLVEFYCENGKDVEVHSYIEDNELSIKF